MSGIKDKYWTTDTWKKSMEQTRTPREKLKQERKEEQEPIDLVRILENIAIFGTLGLLVFFGLFFLVAGVLTALGWW